MKHLPILLLLSFISTIAIAQEDDTKGHIVTVETTMRDYSDGYIITLKNDTIYGGIRDRFPDRGSLANDKVVLKDKNGDKTTYYSMDIKGYCKGDVEYYFTVLDGKMKCFARLINDGELKLLKRFKMDRIAYPTGGGGVGFVSNPYTAYFLCKSTTGEITKVMERDFYRVMSVYFSDCEPLSDKILKKELRHKDMEVIVETYNQWKRDQKNSE